jgi:hypothetical protein
MPIPLKRSVHVVDGKSLETSVGILCWHTLSLILKESLRPNDPNWYHECFRVPTDIAMYSAERPQITTSGRLELRELLPPERKQGKGRPKRKRYESRSEAPRYCGACGMAGHMAKNCQAPCTKFRCETNWKSAIAYAKKLVTLGSDDL